MGVYAVIGVIAVSALIGLAVPYLLASKVSYEWLAIGLAGAIGAYVGSEFIVPANPFGVTTWGAELDGLFIVPAVVVGLLFALFADLTLRVAGPEPTTA
jgi:hypothetical protein